MDRILVIDTATPACSVALFEGGDLLASEYQHLGRGHAERLIPMIEALPDKGKASDIRVNIGPGSFTGIRVGISAARALALAWNANCSGYNCLAMVAAMAANRLNSPCAVDTAMLAGHGEYFFQPFSANGAELAAIKSISPQEAANMSAAKILAGSAALAMAELRGSGTAIDILPDAQFWPLISSNDPLPPDATYIRAADAKPQSAKKADA